MKLVLKNTSLQFKYHELNWESYSFNPNDAIEVFINGDPAWNEAGYCYLIPATGIKKVKIIANSLKTAGFAMLRSNAHVVGTTPAFCLGTSRNAISAGTAAEFVIPEDCQYLYVFSGGKIPTDTKDQHLPASFKVGSYSAQ